MREAQHMDVFRSMIWELATEFGRKCNEGMVTNYWTSLIDLEWEAFERAVHRIKREGQGFPRPIDIRRASHDGPEESEPEKARKKERAILDGEIEEWAKDRPRVEKDAERFRRLMAHSKGEHKTEPVKGCDSCIFERMHAAPHLHLRPGLVAGDVDWSHRGVVGCCDLREPPR